MNPMSAGADSARHSPLGQPTDYGGGYAPGRLFALARSDSRRLLGIGADCPFVGADVWNAYELSWLDPLGKPVVALGRFVFAAGSPAMIESKSLKLYLNSLNQVRIADRRSMAAILSRDLAACAGAPVSVELRAPGAHARDGFGDFPGESLDLRPVAIDSFRYRPEHLQANVQAPEETVSLHSCLLKSNCLVTGQPDWGSVLIRYRGRPIDRDGLLRYIVSFREHNEFHEQCVERMFMDILSRCRPSALLVAARYTRRGGLDINPWRADPASGWTPPAQQDWRQ